MSAKGRLVGVYVAYVDDSGVTDTRCQFAVFAAAVLNDLDVLFVEEWAGKEMAELFGSDRARSIPEFNGRDLLRGMGAFEGIDEKKRSKALWSLLEMFPHGEGMFVTYGAVDRHAISNTVLASIDPADVAFRQCLIGVEKVLAERSGNRDESAILVMDDTGDIGLKQRLRNTFRLMRRRSFPNPADIDGDPDRGMLPHFLDDFYFGESRDCAGLQVADLCAYCIGLHLRGDGAAKEFYELFQKEIYYSEVFPHGGIKL